MNRHRCTYLVAIPLAAILAARGAGQAVTTTVDLSQPLTLDSAIQFALANHNQIGVAQSQLDAARARVTEAKSNWFPQITPSYAFNQQVTTEDTPTGRQTGTFTTNVSQVALQQSLFDMGKRELNIAMSKDSAQMAVYGVLDARQAVILTVSTSWYNLLRQRDLVRVAESGAERAKATLESTQAAVAAGTTAQKDVLQAEADYETAQVQIIEAQNNASLAQTSLRTAMGITSNQPITTAGGVSEVPSIAPDNSSLADYTNQALANRPDFRSAQTGIASDRKSVRVARIEAGPQISSSLSEGYRIHPDPGENRSISATISFPLFDAGATRARVREAKANLTAAEKQLELSRQAIVAAVESAYLQREAAIKRLGATQTALKAAQVNYQAATESHKEGTGTILDVITAQNSLVTADTNAVQAIYDYFTANATLQRAIGGNDPDATKGGNQ